MKNNSNEPIGQALKHSTGPHTGKLISLGDELLELCIAERGGMFYFRLYCYHQSGQPEPPFPTEIIKLKTIRRDGAEEHFTFRQDGEALESMSQVAAPHVFRIAVTVTRNGQTRTETLDFTARDDIHEGPR